ncbi:MAG: thioredoxin family protein [bacterium]
MIKRKNVILQMILLFILAVSLMGSPSVFASNSIHWKNLSSAIKNNKTNKKVFLLHFYYPTCSYCIRMDRNVFSSKRVINYLNAHFHNVMVDIYSHKKVMYFNGKYMSDSHIASKFNITGTPTEIFFSPAYKKIFILPGYWSKNNFLLVAKWIGSGKYKAETLRKFSHSQ